MSWPSQACYFCRLPRALPGYPNAVCVACERRALTVSGEPRWRRSGWPGPFMVDGVQVWFRYRPSGGWTAMADPDACPSFEAFLAVHGAAHEYRSRTRGEGNAGIPERPAGVVDATEGETKSWCLQHLRVDDPQRSLRTAALRPRIVDGLDSQGVITADPEAWAEAVAEVSTKRRALLRGRVEGGGSGRILAFRPTDNLFDGAAELASDGFFDINNVPPWDTWFRFKSGILYAWIPSELAHLVQAAVDCSAEMCIWWADEGDPTKRVNPGLMAPVILKVLAESSRSKPVDLVGLIHGIDWLDRTVLYPGEFNDVLRPLVESGRVVQDGNRYWLSSDGKASRFVPVEASVYRDAEKQYRAEFDAAYSALKAKDTPSKK